MSNDFKIVLGRKTKFALAYENAFIKEVIKINKDNMKVIFYGMKAINLLSNQQKAKDKESRILNEQKIIEYGDIVFLYLSRVTPKEFLRCFPTNKNYDGKKYECKDWFNVQEEIKKYPENQPLGEFAMDFLWDTSHFVVNSFVAKYLSALDRMSMMNGQKGMLESFFDSIDVTIDKWVINEQDNVLINTETNEIIKLEPKIKTRFEIITSKK